MKRTLVLIQSIALALILLVGCNANKDQQNGVQPTDTVTQAANGAESLKTGFAVISSTEKSKEEATGGGTAQADSVLVAVLVDNDGKIVNCSIDSIQTKITFDATGKITTPLDTMVKTKTELGEEYGLKKASAIGKEWNEQIAAFADYAIGKTVEEIKGIAVNEKGAPTITELSSSVTISIGDYIAGIEKAVANAQELGAKKGDKLGIGAVTNIAKSKDAAAKTAEAEEKDGVAQAYSIYAASTFGADGKITSCIIDGSQTNVNISLAGKITSDLKAVPKTKNELGTEYGMLKASSIGKEWNEQANAFSKYVVGKTVEEVKGISVNEEKVPQVEELKSSVTVSIGDFMVAIEKAQEKAE